ncbi:MAG TPA: phosphoesterase [Sulfurimonas autotrophica]|nr:phosphoesterase [Sulfurimonas autotrophica]
MIAFNDIENAKQIVIKADNNSFANANALYSYILSLHKKVFLVATQKIETKFSFLPWFDKVRETLPTKADVIIEAESDTVGLYLALKHNNVKINQKMATALFAGLIETSEGFLSTTCNGTTFAIASELIELKAQYITCKEYLQKSDSLALFRLKSLLYKNMLQKSNGESMHLYISEEDLKSSGATQRDVEKVLKESLKIVHVKEVVLHKSDENNKIIKIVKEL